jgi:hypothetical protein
MKTHILITCFFIFIFAKCKKDNNDPGGQYYGYAKAIVNGNLLTFNIARAGFFNNNPDSVGVIFEQWDGLIAKEVVSFGPMVKTILLNQKIFKAVNGGSILTSNYSTLRDDGDVLCDFYNIYEPDSLQNFITITSFNTQTKEIRGTFQATYIIDTTRLKCRLSAPDILLIRNGEFYTKIF